LKINLNQLLIGPNPKGVGLFLWGKHWPAEYAEEKIRMARGDAGNAGGIHKKSWINIFSQIIQFWK
jgi:hypothetical protein